MAFCYRSIRELRRGHKALVPGVTGSNCAGQFMLPVCQADAQLVSVGSLLSGSLLAALMEHNKQQEFISLEAAKSKV